MKRTEETLERYEADEGKVFDWADLTKHTHIDPETKEVIQDHLYAKVIYIGKFDSINNYVEVDEPLK